MKLIKTLVAAAILLASTASFATVVTAGSLSREIGSQTIQDSLNGRQWLGWDVTKGLTYAQTVTATQSGGMFAGYTISTNVDAQKFVDAMVGANSCNTTEHYSTCAHSNDDNRKAVTGDSYDNYLSYGYGYDYDYVWFLGDSGDVGLIENVTYPGAGADSVMKMNHWSSFATADYYSNVSYSIGWLLYKDGYAEVPEPSSLALVAVALFAVGRARRRR